MFSHFTDLSVTALTPRADAAYVPLFILDANAESCSSFALLPFVMFTLILLGLTTGFQNREQGPAKGCGAVPKSQQWVKVLHCNLKMFNLVKFWSISLDQMDCSTSNRAQITLSIQSNTKRWVN